MCTHLHIEHITILFQEKYNNEGRSDQKFRYCDVYYFSFSTYSLLFARLRVSSLNQQGYIVYYNFI